MFIDSLSLQALPYQERDERGRIVAIFLLSFASTLTRETEFRFGYDGCDNLGSEAINQLIRPTATAAGNHPAHSSH